MSKILKNNTGSPVNIADVGQTVPASGQLVVVPTDYLLYAASNNVITLIGNSTLTVNDGSFDLSISDGIDLIKDNLRTKIGVLSGDDLTAIGHISDQLKVTSNPNSTPGSPVVSNKLRIIVNNTTTQLTATYQTVYTYTGSGKFSGFDIRFDRSGASVKLTIDGTEVIFDFDADNLSSVQSTKILNGVAVTYDSSKEVLSFSPRFSILYNSSINIEAKDVGVGALANVTGYLISLTKET
jgi:hypothetical protein